MSSEWDTDIAQLLIVGNFPTGPFIDIGTDVPAVVVAYYATHFAGSVLAKAWIGMVVDANNYWWFVIGASGGGTPFTGYGRVIAGVCTSAYEEYDSLPTPPVSARFYSEFDLWAHWWVKTNINFAINSADPNQDWTVNGRSMGRGLILSESFTVAFTSTAVAGAEQVAYTMVGSGQYPNNRAYEIKVYAAIKSAAVQSPVFNIRETAVGGTQLVNGRVAIPVTGIDLSGNGCVREGVFLNTSGGIINQPIVLTLAPQVATAVSLDAAPGLIVIRDVGAATDYPGRPSLT